VLICINAPYMTQRVLKPWWQWTYQNSAVKRAVARAIPGWVTSWEVWYGEPKADSIVSLGVDRYNQPTSPSTHHHTLSLFKSPYPHRHAIIDGIVLQAINQNPHRHDINLSLFRSPSPLSHGSAQTFGPFARGFCLDIFGSGLVWDWWK
jgi:hypothetical protein